MTKKIKLVFLGVMMFFSSGCGYTTSSFVSIGQNRIFIKPFVNKIKLTQEVTDTRMYTGYKPGMETNVTRAIIDRFLIDGNFNIGKENDCDVLMEGELVDYRKDALRYDSNDNIIEYRLKIVINFTVTDKTKNKVIVEEKNFVGETTFRTSGTYSKTEEGGLRDAYVDLATRVVEKVVEGW